MPEQETTRRGPGPIKVRKPYFATRCERCGWRGSSEQCVELPTGCGDADVMCPACERVFLCNEVAA